MSSRTSRSSSSRSSTSRSSSRRSSSLPSKNMCYNWLKHPQVSIRGNSYKLGDLRPGTDWATSYIPCHQYMPEFYGDDIMKPLQLLKFVENGGLRNDAEVEKIEAILINFENFQKYISSTIIAYGILISEQHKSLVRKPISIVKNLLQEFYEYIYHTYVDNYHPSQEQLDLIVEPENFLRLDNIEFTDRLKKAVSDVKIPDDVCVADHNKGCAEAFGTVPKNALLYALANSIKCICDILRTHVTLINSPTLESIDMNNRIKDINKVSEQDFLIISEDLYIKHYVTPIKDPIDIEFKTPENCANKPMFYLNQVRDTLFIPNLITGQNRLKELFTSYIQQIEEIVDDNGELIHTMSPPIRINFYKLNERNEKIYDQVVGPGPIINLFDDIALELFKSGIFTQKKGIFDTERYVINPSKSYDYEYIGMLFRFLLINRIRIPFKLSRAYICKLFGLCEFNSNSRNIHEQLILITIYILETGTSFKELVINILKNPELLKNDDFCAASGIFQNCPARMNDYEDIVSEDREIYNDDPNVLLYNIVQFLYKNAVKQYFENENSITFFQGFGQVNIFTAYKSTIGLAEGTPITIAFPIPKLDVYISGGAISISQIEKLLLPKIYRHILANPNEHSINNQYRLLMKVVMNTPQYFSDRFKEAYDAMFEPPKSLTKEQYHLEFVKYLLKFWTGSSHISELYYYGILLLPGSTRTNAEYLLPKAATCSQQLKLRKQYETVESLYEDLVSSIIESSFGKEFGIA